MILSLNPAYLRDCYEDKMIRWIKVEEREHQVSHSWKKGRRVGRWVGNKVSLASENKFSVQGKV